MVLEEQIITAFPKALIESGVSDNFIINNQNLMDPDGNIDHFSCVPSYMLWCINKNKEELVDNYTVNALAEYGKTI